MKRYVLIMSCALLCTCAFGDVASNKPVVGRVSGLAGTVWWIREGKDPEKDLKKADVGLALRRGDMLATDNDSTAQVDFLDGSTMRLGEMSRCVIRKKSVSAKKPTKLHLFGGKIRVKVGAGKVARGIFEVTTPTAVAGVRGTDFMVDCPVGKVTKIVVFEGVVAVSNMMGEVAGVVDVPARHSTNVGAAQAPAMPVEVPADELSQMEADMSMDVDAGAAEGGDGAAAAGGEDEGEGEDEGDAEADAEGTDEGGDDTGEGDAEADAGEGDAEGDDAGGDAEGGDAAADADTGAEGDDAAAADDDGAAPADDAAATDAADAGDAGAADADTAADTAEPTDVDGGADTAAVEPDVVTDDVAADAVGDVDTGDAAATDGVSGDMDNITVDTTQEVLTEETQSVIKEDIQETSVQVLPGPPPMP